MKEKSYVAVASLAVCAGLAWSCKDSTAEPKGVWHAKVAGVVQDTAQKPVSNVLVTVQTMDIRASQLATRGRCTGTLRPAVATRTSANGQYSVQIQGVDDPVQVCVFVDAAGLSAGRLVTGGAEVDSVALGPSPLDSLRVDIVARP